jgi:hypothetical protein
MISMDSGACRPPATRLQPSLLGPALGRQQRGDECVTMPHALPGISEI